MNAISRNNVLSKLMVLTIVGLVAASVSVGVVAEEDETKVVNRAVSEARKLLKSDNPYDQISGAGTLADVGDPNALDILIAFARSEDFVYQRSAIDTLVQVQHPRGLDAVYRIAAEEPQALHFLTQSLATNPRVEMGDFLVGVLQSDKPLIQQYALQALVHIKDTDVIDATNDLLARKDVMRSTKAYAYYLLASRGMGEEVEDDIHDIIAKGDLSQKEVAAVALAFIETDTAREAVKNLMTSSDARVHLAALATDASFGNRESLAEFVRIITHGKTMNAEVAASAVRRLPDDTIDAVTDEVILKRIRPDPGARLLESWRVVDKDASKVYEWGLAHDNLDIVTQTLWLAGQRQERHLLSRLASFLDHDSAQVRAMASWAIVHIAADSYVPGTEV